MFYEAEKRHVSSLASQRLLEENNPALNQGAKFTRIHFFDCVQILCLNSLIQHLKKTFLDFLDCLITKLIITKPHIGTCNGAKHSARQGVILLFGT